LAGLSRREGEGQKKTKEKGREPVCTIQIIPYRIREFSRRGKYRPETARIDYRVTMANNPTPLTAPDPASVPQGAPDNSYVLTSITQTTSPPGSTGVSAETDWYRYVIDQGENQIVGYRHGSPEDVRAAVGGIVEQLNARRTVKATGRKHITIGQTAKP